MNATDSTLRTTPAKDIIFGDIIVRSPEGWSFTVTDVSSYPDGDVQIGGSQQVGKYDPEAEFLVAPRPATHRVIYAWGVAEDFVNLSDALRFMADRLEEPQRDPALRNVHLVTLDPEKHEEHGYYITVVEGQRPAAR